MNVSGVRQGANPAGLPQIRRRGDDSRHQDEANQVNHRQNARDPYRGCVYKHAVRAASASAAIDIGELTCGRRISGDGLPARRMHQDIAAFG